MTKAFKQGFMDMMRKIAQTVPPAPKGPIEQSLEPADKADIASLGGDGVDDDVNLFNQGVNTYLGPNAGIHTPIQASQIAKNFLAAEPTIASAPYLHPLVGNALLQRGIDALPDPGPGVRQPTPYELAEYFRTLGSRVVSDEEREVPGAERPAEYTESTEVEPIYDDDGNYVASSTRTIARPLPRTYTTTDTQDRLRESFSPLFNLFPGYVQAPTLEDKDDFIGDILNNQVAAGAGLSALRADPKLQDEFARRVWNQATNAVPISVTSAGRETP